MLDSDYLLECPSTHLPSRATFAAASFKNEPQLTDSKLLMKLLVYDGERDTRNRPIGLRARC
jgi:hypothetical protein